MTYINPYYAKNKGRLLEFKNPNRHNWIKYNWESSLTDFDLNILGKDAILIKDVATGNLDDIASWDIAMRFHFISVCFQMMVDRMMSSKLGCYSIRYSIVRILPLRLISIFTSSDDLSISYKFKALSTETIGFPLTAVNISPFIKPIFLKIEFGLIRNSVSPFGFPFSKCGRT